MGLQADLGLKRQFKPKLLWFLTIYPFYIFLPLPLKSLLSWLTIGTVHGKQLNVGSELSIAMECSV